MKRHRRIYLGFAAAVLIALATSSSAAAADFHTSATSASLVGQQSTTHKITIDGSSFTCTTATFTGTSPGTKTFSSFELQPQYSGCTAFGFAGATISTTGCQFKFEANSEEMELKSCANGTGITIHVSAFFGTTTCHVDIENARWGANTKTNTPGHRILHFLTELKGLKYKVTESKGLCPLTKGKEATDGTYEGETLIDANGEASELWIE